MCDSSETNGVTMYEVKCGRALARRIKFVSSEDYDTEKLVQAAAHRVDIDVPLAEFEGLRVVSDLEVDGQVAAYRVWLKTLTDRADALDRDLAEDMPHV